jgi:MFS family permease
VYRYTMARFVRDPLTRLGYVMIAWFAYLQASPGLVVPHLRDELDLGYLLGGLHVAAFSAGAAVAGTGSSWLERAVGRTRLLWTGAAVLGAGAVGLTAGRTVEQTIAATLLMGIGGGLVLATAQATLADHQGPFRTVALTEANVAASVAYLVLIGMFSVTAALHAGWRVAILASLLVPVLVWWVHRRSTFDAPPDAQSGDGRLPGAFWVAALVLVCTTAAEWCITAWGASFLQDALRVPTDAAVSLMVGYFGGVLAGRVLGSRLARRIDPTRLLAWALAVAGLGFAVMWPAASTAQALVGLALLGVGLGNLFPLGMSVAVALAPGQAGAASGRAVAMTSLAVLLAPLLVGTAADATSLRSALAVVPVLLALALVGLLVVRRQARLADAAGPLRPADQRRG